MLHPFVTLDLSSLYTPKISRWKSSPIPLKTTELEQLFDSKMPPVFAGSKPSGVAALAFMLLGEE